MRFAALESPLKFLSNAANPTLLAQFVHEILQKEIIFLVNVIGVIGLVLQPPGNGLHIKNLQDFVFPPIFPAISGKF